jgi:anti-sigma factor ChrR (cupin superfamily)
MSKHPHDRATDNRAPTLSTERREAMRERLLERAGRDMTVSRAERQQWRAFLPGIRVKLLHCDEAAGVQTALWRMAPGARIPAHPHDHDEECYILEGALEHRGERFVAGDYMVAHAGSRHSQITAPEGATMLIRGEMVRWHERLLLRVALAMGR